MGSWCFWQGAGQTTLFGDRSQIQLLHEIQAPVRYPICGIVFLLHKEIKQKHEVWELL